MVSISKLGFGLLIGATVCTAVISCLGGFEKESSEKENKNKKDFESKTLTGIKKVKGTFNQIYNNMEHVSTLAESFFGMTRPINSNNLPRTTFIY